MTNDIHPSDDGEQHPSDTQHAVEACEHAVDALESGDLSHARSLLDEARAAVERAQHDSGVEQAQREIVCDCYD